MGETDRLAGLHCESRLGKGQKPTCSLDWLGSRRLIVRSDSKFAFDNRTDAIVQLALLGLCRYLRGLRLLVLAKSVLLQCALQSQRFHQLINSIAHGMRICFVMSTPALPYIRRNPCNLCRFSDALSLQLDNAGERDI